MVVLEGWCWWDLPSSGYIGKFVTHRNGMILVLVVPAGDGQCWSHRSDTDSTS